MEIWKPVWTAGLCEPPFTSRKAGKLELRGNSVVCEELLKLNFKRFFFCVAGTTEHPAHWIKQPTCDTFCATLLFDVFTTFRLMLKLTCWKLYICVLLLYADIAVIFFNVKYSESYDSNIRNFYGVPLGLARQHYPCCFLHFMCCQMSHFVSI